jgi:hypothetical protein
MKTMDALTKRKIIRRKKWLRAGRRFMIGMIFMLILLAGQSAAQESRVSGYADLNGLKMYYEIQGTGRPLVLIHSSLAG